VVFKTIPNEKGQNWGLLSEKKNRNVSESNKLVLDKNEGIY